MPQRHDILIKPVPGVTTPIFRIILRISIYLIWLLTCNVARIIIIHYLFVGQRRTGTPTEPGFSQGFFPSFWPWRSFGSLPPSPLAFGLLSWGHLNFNYITDLPALTLYDNWNELDDITVFTRAAVQPNQILLHYFPVTTVKLLWNNCHCKKRYINKGDLIWFEKKSFN